MSGTNKCPVSRNIWARYDILISVLKVWDMDTVSRCIVSCDIAWYGIWYHDRSRYISCAITPDHPETTGEQTRNLVAAYGLFFLSVFALFLVCLSSVPSFLSYLCCPSAGHIIALTAPPANKNSTPCPLRAGLTPKRMYVCFRWSYLCFSPFYSFLSLSFCPSWYP